MTAPPPQPRVFLTAEWRSLLMLNYAIDPAVLRPLVPHGVELDLWQGEALISMVGFLFLHTRVMGVPIPFHRNFEEVNLRFYGRRETSEGWRRAWMARNAQLDCDADTLYGGDFTRALAAEPVSAFLPEGSPISVRRGARIEAA